MATSVALVMLGRAVLACVFLAAATAKLFDSDPSGDIATTFGFKSSFARRGSELLPLVELAVGASLVWPATTLLGAGLALLLLMGFTAIVITSLRRGETPRCNCFGAASASPIGRRTVWRNVTFAALALLVVVIARSAPGPSLLAWVGGGLTTEFLAFCCLVLVLGMAGAQGTLRRMGAAHRSLMAVVAELERALDQQPSHRNLPAPEDGLPIGAPAPQLVSSTPDGTLIRLSDLLALNHPVLLFYLGTGCAACTPLDPHIRVWASQARRRLTLAVLFAGHSTNEAFGGDVVVLTGDAVRQAEWFRLNWTPGAVLITRRGTIGSPVAVGHEAVLRLAGPLASSHAPETAVPTTFIRDKSVGLPLGSSGPDGVVLPGSGERALIFWQANCSHCQAMYPQLRRWIDNEAAAGGRPALVIVNWGREPVPDIEDLVCVDDPAGNLARHFRVTGTPSALRIDANGRVASGVGAGVLNVMALLGSSDVAWT